MFFFNGDGLQFMDVKSQVENVIQKLVHLDIVIKAKRQKRMIMLHYDNAPLHNAMLTQEYLGSISFKRVHHPPYRIVRLRYLRNY